MFLRERSSPPFTFIFFVIAGICAGCAGRTASGKTHTSPTTPDVATAISGLLKVAWGDYWGACILATAGRLPPPTPIPL